MGLSCADFKESVIRSCPRTVLFLKSSLAPLVREAVVEVGGGGGEMGAIVGHSVI